MTAARVVLRLTDVVKTFPGVMALKGVGLEVVEGEVHALVGENGAGKSTLMAVAAGSTLPDTGIVEIGGLVMEQPSPAAAQAMGLAVVYQHLSILEDLTVAETMVFAMPRGRRPSLLRAGPGRAGSSRWSALRSIRRRGSSELSVADRQLVEIAKALALEPKVLVLDEPTESLTPRRERAAVRPGARDHARPARPSSTSRTGSPRCSASPTASPCCATARRAARVAAASVSEAEILRLIIGRSVDQAFPPKAELAADGEPLLSVRGLSGPRFHDVDLDVRPGEIVGLAGVEGNGQREFLRALAGLVPRAAGR